MKVLLADDDPVARAMLSRWLEGWGYDVTVVRDGSEALDVLTKDPSIRLLIADWMMPTLDGIDVIRAVRAGPQEPYLYTILITARTDKRDVVQGLEAGADDYIVKPWNPLELEVRLRAGRRVIDLQESLIRAREQLRHESMRDALTGLLNRAALLDHLDRELVRFDRNRGSVCAVMIDVDEFKQVNDVYGHLAGDRVLRDFARRFEHVLRTYDEVGRFGGEEFLMVLSDCDELYGHMVAERMRAELASRPVRTHAGALQVSASFGVASTRQVPGATAERLLRAADAALYRAKAAGRNGVCIATDEEWAEATADTSGTAA